MPQFPLTVMDLFSQTDPGRRLTDPAVAYQAMQLQFGWQKIIGAATSPGPLASQAMNVVNGPAVGAGSLFVQLAYALAGRAIQIVNLSSSTLQIILQTYNPATARPDHLTYGSALLPLPIGSLTDFVAYEPGFWVLVPTSAPPVTVEASEG